MTPEQQLESAFDDVDALEKEVAKREEAEQDAQKVVGDTSGLVAAARRASKNKEAQFRVLSAEYDEAKSLREKKKRIEEQLNEIAQAETVRDATQAAVQPLTDAVAAVSPVAGATQQAMDATSDAKSQVDSAIETIDPDDDQDDSPPGAQGKPLPAAQRKPRRNGRADKRNSLMAISGSLGTDYGTLQQLSGQINGSLADLQGNAGEVQAAATAAANFADGLQPKKVELLEEQSKIDAKLATVPSEDDVDKARDKFESANRRFEDAPSTERQAQETLKSAREAKEDAQRRYREALDRRDKAEGLFIKGIDITGPNAAGVFTATADLAEPLPRGYDLYWSSEAGTVKPDTGKRVGFDTGKLPPGSYDIQVCVVRIQQTT
jgi:chromosome segregation ATPase